MGVHANAARDVSYAHSAVTRGGRAVIRLMENATGRIGLIRRALGYETEVAAGRAFFAVMAERYGLRLDVAAGSLATIPATGPVILVANHPYGILDGLMMAFMLEQTRGDFRILANAVFRKAHDVDRVILPISFDESRAAQALNLETRQAALAYLGAGGAIGIFPGGTVSTAARPFSRPMDPGWRSFTARLIARSGATVVPVYFDGHTSRLFQIASHAHMTPRMGLLIREFGRRMDSQVRVCIGEPVPPAQFGTDSKAMMDFLRKATYDLSPDPQKHFDLGYEFEARCRS